MWMSTGEWLVYLSMPKSVYMLRSEYVHVHVCLQDVIVMFKSDFFLHPVASPVDRIVKRDFRTGEILIKSDIVLQPVAGPIGRLLMGATGRMLVFLISLACRWPGRRVGRLAANLDTL